MRHLADPSYTQHFYRCLYFFQVENILMDDNGTYVLCDFGSATAKFWNPKLHSVKDIDEELTRLLLIIWNE